ncbi:LysR family transcriptional regulator [Panacagrimonas sp.]|uniref:LysR family transcriptional regulator n=1 Tax=Panacagrimonas sp. TaxID=2480088 RepID=UPI003B51D446
MDWNDLRFVLAITQGGSLAAAARNLDVNISSVYRRLEGLEQSLGVKLFDRLRDRYRLTSAGQALAAAAERMDAEAKEAARRVRGADERLEGPLRLSTGGGVAFHLLPRHLAAFTAQYPGISLEVGVTDEIVDLARRDVDVVIRDSPRAPEHLVGRKVARLGMAAYATTKVLERWGTDSPLDALPWLSLECGFARLPEVKSQLRRASTSRVKLRFDSVEAMRAAVAEGVGVGVLPCFIGDSDMRLERVPGSYAPTNMHLWVLAHPDLRRSARVRAFLKFFGERLLDERDRILGVALKDQAASPRVRKPARVVA